MKQLKIIWWNIEVRILVTLKSSKVRSMLCIVPVSNNKTKGRNHKFSEGVFMVQIHPWKSPRICWLICQKSRKEEPIVLNNLLKLKINIWRIVSHLHKKEFDNLFIVIRKRSKFQIIIESSDKDSKTCFQLWRFIKEEMISHLLLMNLSWRRNNWKKLSNISENFKIDLWLMNSKCKK